MTNEDSISEIESLRKQLEELQNQRKKVEATETVESKQDDAVTSENTTEPDISDSLEEVLSLVDGNDSEHVSQFRDLLDSIDKDIKETKPSTLLIVFALGVLIGRMR